MLTRLRALQLLSKCSGIDVWPPELCRQEGIPNDWIEELAEAHESGFRSIRQTLFVEENDSEKLVNQFFGVHDLKLAFRLGEFLGVDTSQIHFQAFSDQQQVAAIREAVEEL